MKKIIITLIFICVSTVYSQNDRDITVLKSDKLTRLDSRTKEDKTYNTKVKLLIDNDTKFMTFYTYKDDELVIFKILGYETIDNDTLSIKCIEKSSQRDVLVMLYSKMNKFYITYRDDPYIYIFTISQFP